MPQYPVLKLINIQDLTCGSELGFTCAKRICVCTPDQNNTSKIPACEVVGDKMPDCYLVEILGTKRVAMVIECRCNIQPGSRTLKEPAKLEKDVDAKFQNFSGQGKRMVVIPRGTGKGVEDALRKRWEVAYCGEEICRVCSWCS